MNISIASLIGFAIAMFILAATPGPAFFSLTARSIASGPMAGIGVAMGVMVADVIYFTLALIGMSRLSETIGSAFIAFKIIGGVYLIWLGIQMWRSKPVQIRNTSAINSRSALKNFAEGLAVNLSNPKAIIFFAALLPTFINLKQVGPFDAAALIATIIVVGVSIDLFYVFLAAQARRWLHSDRSQIIINRVGGTTLIGVGATVVTR